MLSLRGNLAKIKSLSLWMSHFPLNGSRPQIFEKMPDVAVVGGQLKLTLLKDAVYTLSNRGASARKGQHPPSPPSSPFPTRTPSTNARRRARPSTFQTSAARSSAMMGR